MIPDILGPASPQEDPMTLATEVRIVEATKEHIPFVAWVVMAANRSHMPKGMWDLILGDDEERVLRYLEAFVQTDQVHWGRYDMFLVAEVDGVPAAGLCGFFENEMPMALMMAGAIEANTKAGISGLEFAEGWERAKSITALGGLTHEPGCWVVEHVACKPEFRRRGLVEGLIGAMLERGRARGATVADIGVFIDNTPAQRLYEKCGFEVVQEARDASFEAAYGCPGARQLRKSL
jgi:ribosomal protein S18 acetylase RimI-like enzyme